MSQLSFLNESKEELVSLVANKLVECKRLQVDIDHCKSLIKEYTSDHKKLVQEIDACVERLKYVKQKSDEIDQL